MRRLRRFATLFRGAAERSPGGMAPAFGPRAGSAPCERTPAVSATARGPIGSGARGGPYRATERCSVPGEAKTPHPTGRSRSGAAGCRGIRVRWAGAGRQRATRRRSPRSGAVRTARAKRWLGRAGRGGVSSWMMLADSRAATAEASGTEAGAWSCPRRATCRSSRSPVPPRIASTAGIGTRRGLLEWSIPGMTTKQTVPHRRPSVTVSSGKRPARSGGLLRVSRRRFHAAGHQTSAGYATVGTKPPLSCGHISIRRCESGW